jgi:transposase
MRDELADYEWIAIKPMLPNKPRGVPRVNDRRVLNGIFWVLCSGAPWRDLPETFGPYTTCYNRFVRSRRAGVWGRIINALAAAHDAAVQMIDTSVVRVHQHGARITRNQRQSMGRSRGGLTSKIHAVADSNGLPVRVRVLNRLVVLSLFFRPSAPSPSSHRWTLLICLLPLTSGSLARRLTQTTSL